MTTEAILFADPVELVATYLRAQLPSHGYTAIHVGALVPNPAPTRFVRVDRVGGPRANLIHDTPTLVVEAWAGSVPAAHALLATCRALIGALVGTTQGGTPIYRVSEFSGPGTLPDPTSNQPRATYTVQLTLRGETL